jgi:hypothetical protein
MNNDLENIWQEGVVDEARCCPSICQERLKRTVKNVNRSIHTWYPSLNSNQIPHGTEVYSIATILACSIP